jgi:uncharacterized protein YbdZ (MbtH family)
MNCFDRDHAVLIVLQNHEGDHALWPQWKQLPTGWHAVPELRGDKASVLARLERLALGTPCIPVEHTTLGRTAHPRLQADTALAAEVDDDPATEPTRWAWPEHASAVALGAALAPTLTAQPRP